jgi:hypothetical protein
VKKPCQLCGKIVAERSEAGPLPDLWLILAAERLPAFLLKKPLEDVFIDFGQLVEVSQDDALVDFVD